MCQVSAPGEGGGLCGIAYPHPYKHQRTTSQPVNPTVPSKVP